MMPRGTRQNGVERATSPPLVSSRRGKFRTLEGCELEAEIHEKLGEYKQFVREMEGEEPTNGAVCSAALEMLFVADKGFERYLSERRKKNRNGAGASGGDGMNGARGGATTAQEKGRRAESQSLNAAG